MYKSKHVEQSAKWQRENKERVNEAARLRRARMTREEKDLVNARQRARYARGGKVRETLKRLAAVYRTQAQFVISQKLRLATLGHAGRMSPAYGPFMEAVTGMSREEFSGSYCGNGQFDHIVPLVSFDLTKPEHVVRAMHPSNIRMVPAWVNQSKGDSGRLEDVMTLPWVGTEDALARAAALIARVSARLPLETPSLNRGHG